MTDKGGACRARRFRKALRWPGIRLIHTRRSTPKTDGKAARFRQTLLRDRACGLARPSSDARNDGLPRWRDRFNGSRPHCALDGQTLPAVNTLMRNRSWRRSPR